MLKYVFNNLLFKFKMFILNIKNDELSSKIYKDKILRKIKLTNKESYILDGFKVYSQNDEDGIIESIFNDIEITNKKFIEIGIGNGIENNSHFLLLKGWSGLWIDCNKNIKKLHKLLPKNNKLNLFKKLISPENINQIFNEYLNEINEKEGFNLDFLSIDIDTYDIECITAIRIIKPRLICIEYNAKFPPNFRIGINLKKNHKWNYDDYFGSSLLMVEQEMKKINYELISTNISGSNAFFVKKDLYVKCKTKGQTLNDLYMSPNYNLYNYYIGHKPSLKFLIQKLKKG